MIKLLEKLEFTINKKDCYLAEKSVRMSADLKDGGIFEYTNYFKIIVDSEGREFCEY